MRETIDGRELAEATGFSHPQIRRWVAAFLPPDPKVGLYAGVPRVHPIDAAFQVVLGGRLVNLGLSIGDARAVLAEAVRILRERNWMPSQHDPEGPIDAILAFGKTLRDTWHFKLQIIWSRWEAKQSGRMVQEYEIIASGDQRYVWDQAPLHLSLTEAVKTFLEDLGNDEDED